MYFGNSSILSILRSRWSARIAVVMAFSAP